MNWAATAKKLPAGGFEQPRKTLATVYPFHAAVSNREVIILGIALAVLQVLDGVLTGIGVSHLGIHVEGNILIRTLMENFGYVQALVFVKVFALVVILGICLLSSRVRWLTMAMKAVILVYVGAAVIPWSFVIARHIL